MPTKAKLYIWLHVFASICIFIIAFQSEYEFSMYKLIPFIIFGCLFEVLRLSVFTVNGQEFTMSAGAAIIVAAIIIFSSLEIIVFATFYGLAIVLFPTMVKDFYKFIFNISQTVNVTFAGYLVWNSFHQSSVELLNVDSVFPLLFTMFTFVILDLLSVSVVISLASGIRLKDIIAESLDWVIVSYGLIAFMGLILAVTYQKFYIYGLVGFAIPLLLMRYNMFLFSKEKEKQVTQLLEFNELLKENNEQLLLTLSQVIDARDNSLFGHSASVAKYAVYIGKKLNLSEEQIYDLKRGALLHDIGKLGISEAILHKPGRLTDEEFNIVKKHTLIGENIIERVKGMEKVAQIIGQHHEHFNGRGYPRSLKEDEILIESRIVALCDAVDTMLSTRSYKEGWSLEAVQEEVLRCRGGHFDPAVTDAFLELISEKGNGFFANSAKRKTNDRDLEALLLRDKN